MLLRVVSYRDNRQTIWSEFMGVFDYEVHPRLVFDLDVETWVQRRGELQNQATSSHCCSSLTSLVISTSSGLIAPSMFAAVSCTTSGLSPHCLPSPQYTPHQSLR